MNYLACNIQYYNHLEIFNLKLKYSMLNQNIRLTYNLIYLYINFLNINLI